MTRKVNLVTHLTRQEIEERYRKERDRKIKERALAILLLYDGMEEEEVAKTLKKCVKTIRNTHVNVQPSLCSWPATDINLAVWTGGNGWPCLAFSAHTHKRSKAQFDV